MDPLSHISSVQTLQDKNLNEAVFTSDKPKDTSSHLISFSHQELSQRLNSTPIPSYHGFSTTNAHELKTGSISSGHFLKDDATYSSDIHNEFLPKIIGNPFIEGNQLNLVSKLDKTYLTQASTQIYSKEPSLTRDLKYIHKVVEDEPLITSNIAVSPDILHQTIILSFFINLCLLGAKIYISITSGSMAVIACTVDSLMDVISGTLILIVQRIILQKRFVDFDKKYPAGRNLLEPVCTIVYATIMGSVSVQLCFFSIQKFFFPGLALPKIDISILFVLFFTVLIKLMLLAFCKLISKRTGDHIFVLTNDHKSDVITNTTVFIICLLIYYNDNLRSLDNLGALFIAGFASFTWIYSHKDQVRILSGYKADPQFYSYVATILSGFSDIKVDEIKAYHFGVRYMVELDIVMDPSTTVREYVKIAQVLQTSIEKLPMVQQCFISIDYQSKFVSMKENNLTLAQKRRPKTGESD